MCMQVNCKQLYEYMDNVNSPICNGQKVEKMKNFDWQTIGESLKPGESKDTPQGSIHHLPTTTRTNLGSIMVANSGSYLSNLLSRKEPGIGFVRVADGDALCNECGPEYEVHLDSLRSEVAASSETFSQMRDSVKTFILHVALYHSGQLLLGLDEKRVLTNTAVLLEAYFDDKTMQGVYKAAAVISGIVQMLVATYERFLEEDTGPQASDDSKAA